MELPTYFILPLTGFNYKDFGKFTRAEWNLKSTKINLQEKYILCEVFDITLISQDIYSGENFIKFIKPRSIKLGIPNTIIKTLKHFERGHYSKFPNSIKEWIKKYSGLPSTHDYILALDKNEALRKRMEKDLGVSLSSEAELLEAPRRTWFIVKEKEERV